MRNENVNEALVVYTVLIFEELIMSSAKNRLQ